MAFGPLKQRGHKRSSTANDIDTTGLISGPSEGDAGTNTGRNRLQRSFASMNLLSFIGTRDQPRRSFASSTGWCDHSHRNSTDAAGVLTSAHSATEAQTSPVPASVAYEAQASPVPASVAYETDDERTIFHQRINDLDQRIRRSENQVAELSAAFSRGESERLQSVPSVSECSKAPTSATQATQAASPANPIQIPPVFPIAAARYTQSQESALGDASQQQPPIELVIAAVFILTNAGFMVPGIGWEAAIHRVNYLLTEFYRSNDLPPPRQFVAQNPPDRFWEPRMLQQRHQQRALELETQIASLIDQRLALGGSNDALEQILRMVKDMLARE